MSKVYSVVFSKMGKVYRDNFTVFEDALDDFKEKKRLDEEGIFDDRFVMWVEDDDGKRMDIYESN